MPKRVISPALWLLVAALIAILVAVVWSHAQTRPTKTITVYSDGAVRVEDFAPPPSAPEEPPTALGTNLNFPSDYDPTQLFANARYSTRAFGSADRPFDGAASVDAKGWPSGRDWGMVIAHNIQNVNGVWKLRMKGQVTSIAVSSGETRNVVSSGGITTADLVVNAPATQPVPVFLSVRGAASGNQDIQVIRPGCSPLDTFNPQTISVIRSTFRGGVRLMDLMGTNFSEIVRKEDRPLPSDVRYTEKKGVSLEHVAALAIAIQPGPPNAPIPVWANIPGGADDECVREYGRILDRLIPEPIPLLVEIGNENWNDGFQTYHRFRALAKASVEAGDPFKLRSFGDAYFKKMWGDNPTNVTNEVHWQWLYQIKRASDLKSLLPKRFKIVFGTQKGYNPPGFLLKMQLSYLETVIGPAKDYLWAGASAPYYGPGEDYMRNPGATREGMIERLRKSVETASRDDQVKAFDQELSSRGLYHLAYEGGDHNRPGFGAIHPSNVPVMIEVMRSPEIRGIHFQYLTNWYGGGRRTFYIFNLCTIYDASGTWGQTWSIYETGAPKLLACKDIAAWLAERN